MLLTFNVKLFTLITDDNDKPKTTDDMTLLKNNSTLRHYATDKAIQKASATTTLIGMKNRFAEEFDLESNRLDVFTVYVEVPEMRYDCTLIKFVFTKKTGKLVYTNVAE